MIYFWQLEQQIGTDNRYDFVNIVIKADQWKGRNRLNCDHRDVNK